LKQEIAMSEQKPQPPNPQYGTGQPPGEPPPGQPPAGQYPPAPPQYPPTQPPPGQYPPQQPPPGPYPQPPAYPPSQPPGGQYPPSQPPYPPPPGGQYPPSQPPSPPYPPAQPPVGQYPPSQPPPPQPPYQQQPPPPQTYPPQPPQPPTPPPTPCPDPCDQPRPWGAPTIDPKCYPDGRDCCGESTTPLPWDEVDDPCARAASAGCGYPSTQITCTCGSSSGDCCAEWDCGYPDSMCVPCKPCAGITPENGGSDTPPPDNGGNGCSSDGLKKQLEANKKSITAQLNEKAKIEANIKARQDRDKDLTALIAGFDTIVDKYKAEHHKLVCREDCLKGFYRDVSKIFDDPARFPQKCKDDLQTAINKQLCGLELAKCCLKNLEWKLEKPTRLIAKQKDAEKAWKKADDAFAQIKDLPKWMNDQFADLEKLKDQIAQALNDKDPEKQKWAFYLFYWKYVPALCKRFKVAICCTPKQPDPTPQPQPTPGTQYSPQPTPGYGQTTPPPPGTPPPPTTPPATPPVQIGCAPGDWHPSKITDDMLRSLICCAWEYVKKQKAAYQDATSAIDTVKANLDLIKKKVDDDGKGLEDSIKAQLATVKCAAS
jgi:hypothetical protein